MKKIRTLWGQAPCSLITAVKNLAFRDFRLDMSRMGTMRYAPIASEAFKV